VAGATIDIATAARATGLSVKAIRGRVERGSLPAELIAGRRRIPIQALLEAGLLVDGSRPVRPAAPEDRLAEELKRLRADVRQLTELVQELVAR
jgi:hypothetical protein